MLQKKQDWIHWYACDPSAKAYLEVFFERLKPQLAIVWVQLRLDGRRLILKEALYTDNSNGKPTITLAVFAEW